MLHQWNYGGHSPQGKGGCGCQAKTTMTSALRTKNKHEDEWNQGIRPWGEKVGEESKGTGYLPNFLAM